MRKQLESVVVILVFLALAFLVYRDLSAHAVIELSRAGAGVDVPAARAAVQQVCERNGGCSEIVYVGQVPETDNVYQQVVYRILSADHKDSVFLIVSLEGGNVVHVR